MLTGDVPWPPRGSKFGVIYADPPWTFKTYSKKGKGRSAEAHYDCMTFADLVQLPVTTLALHDAVLFLWTTDPMLPQALGLIHSWGFEYKTTAFVWVKVGKHPENVLLTPGTYGSKYFRDSFPIGTGYWTRANPEICLLATRGKPTRLSRSVRKLIVSPRREHSRKPDEAYERIEQLCPGPYLELFARSPRDGWTTVGDQINSGPTPRRWRSNAYPEF